MQRWNPELAAEEHRIWHSWQEFSILVHFTLTHPAKRRQAKESSLMRHACLLITFLMLTASPNSRSQSQQSYGFEGGPIASLATGKNASFYTPGFGLRAGAFYDIEPQLRLAFVLGFSSYGLDADAITRQYQLQGGTGSVEVDGNLTAFPIMLSIRLVSPPAGVRFYGDLEVGIFTYWTRASGSIIDGAVVTPVPERSEFRSEPGGSLGVGLLIPIREAFSLDAGVRYSFVKDSEYASYAGSGTTVSVTTSQVISFSLGVSYAVPL